MNDFTVRGELIDHAIAGSGEITDSKALDDPVLLKAMTLRLSQILQSKQLAYEAVLKDTSRSSKVGFQVNGVDSGVFDSMLMSYGFDVLNKTLPVSLSVATRLLKIRGIVQQHEDLYPMVVSALSAFPYPQASVMLSMADTNSIAEHNVSTLICSMERIQRQIFRDVNALTDESLPGCIVIDCFRNISIADVIECYTAIASNELYGDERLIGYYLFPFEDDFLAHVLRYRSAHYTLSEEDSSGRIKGCGLNYVFEGQDVVFSNDISVFHIGIEDYVNMVFSTDFDAGFGDYRLVNEVNEITHGMMIKRINVYKRNMGEIGGVFYDPSRSAGYKLIIGYRLIEGRVTPQPYQVDKKLYEKCYEAVLTLTQLTLDNVRIIVTTQSQTLTSILGRTTQSDALESDKTEAMTMSIYLKAFSATYEATQVLKSDFAVQGKSLDDFDSRFKRSCLTIAGLCTVFPVASLLPLSMLGKVSFLTTGALTGIASIKLLAVKMIESVASLLIENTEWETMAGLTIDQDEYFSIRVEQSVLNNKTSPVLNGLIRHEVNTIYQRNEDLVSSGGKIFEKTVGGTYFDALGNTYESLATRLLGKFAEVQLYTNSKTKLAKYKMGDVYSTMKYNGIELSGYTIFNEEYKKIKHFVAGYSYYITDKENATHTFFDAMNMNVCYCRIVEKYLDGDDVPFLGLQTLKGLDSVKIELSKLQLNSERLTNVMQAGLDKPLQYFDEGVVVCEDISRFTTQERFIEVNKDQVYSLYLRKNSYSDIHITVDLYLNRLKQLAKYVLETGDAHILFGKVLDEWYSIRSDEPIPGLLAYYDRRNKIIKYLFDKTDLDDVEFNSTIVHSFDYMLDFFDSDEESNGDHSDVGTIVTAK